MYCLTAINQLVKRKVLTMADCELKLRPQVGDFVETTHGVSGILTAVKTTYYGETAFIATADMRTFYCPLCDIRRADNG